MENVIKGKVYVLGNNIDTDQIIPAEHLVYSLTDQEESKNYGLYALSSVPIKEAGLPNGNIPFISDNNYLSEYSIIVAGSNFGCGSSREHAPFALQKAGIKVVVAETYARIFYRNAVDGGFVVPYESKDSLIDRIKTGDNIEIDLVQNKLFNFDSDKTYSLNPLGDVLPIIEEGGIFSYARKAGMIT